MERFSRTWMPNLKHGLIIFRNQEHHHNLGCLQVSNQNADGSVNSNEKHGLFRSVVARKAAIRYREISANMILVLMAGESIKQT
jgi:hypothetical protein